MMGLTVSTFLLIIFVDGMTRNHTNIHAALLKRMTSIKYAIRPQDVDYNAAHNTDDEAAHADEDTLILDNLRMYNLK